jgi:hypothetical protein
LADQSKIDPNCQAPQQSERARIRALQKNAVKNAASCGGLVLGANQAHAFALSATLNKIKGINNLTNNNYLSWSKQVKGALGIIFFDQYLLNANFEDFTVGNKINDINKRCILKFLFS